jgi:hypothetical protein
VPCALSPHVTRVRTARPYSAAVQRGRTARPNSDGVDARAAAREYNGRMRVLAFSFVVVVVLGACAPDDGAVDSDVLSGLLRHEAQRDSLCERARDNAVTRIFCGERAPSIASLHDLQSALGIAFDDESSDVAPGFSFVAHSSALPSRSVSAANPGSVIVSLPSHPPDLNGPPNRLRSDGNVVALAYARGDQFVEMAVTPNNGGDFAFYLLRYEQRCNRGHADARGDGARCNNADLFSERTETDWTAISLYDDDDLADTVVDCRECHQPGGPGTPRIYRMQEPENPWTHWSAVFTLSGRVLLDDTFAVQGHDGTIAGIPASAASDTNPVVVEDLVRFTRSEQPNVFDAPTIEAEVAASQPGQPRDNSKHGASAAWDDIYAEAVAGRAIPPPYHDAKVTDAGAVARAAAAFAAFRAGDDGVDDGALDLRRVFSRDPDVLAGMSHRPKRGLDGRGILVHACSQCHNRRLDQTLTRARFDATDVDALDDAEKNLAIERMHLPRADRRHMPPALFRDLSDDEIESASAALR